MGNGGCLEDLQFCLLNDGDGPPELFGIRLTKKGARHRRTTPVKERAAKCGVQLPPTPSGVREAIQSGSPIAKETARKVLQRHQKACHQKVARAEESQQNEEYGGTTKYARHHAEHASTQARYRKRKHQGSTEPGSSP